MSQGNNVCLVENASYDHRVDNPDAWNWCLIPDGGYDAVFFAGMAIAVMAMASPRWDALVSLIAGGCYQVLSHYFNLGHVSNAVNLWLGMRPADIFVYVFLPPILLDSSCRLDWFMLKKTILNIVFMAFAMVITTCMVLIPFMLYALDLQSSGWNGGYVALFGAAISSTDAASVCAALAAGGAPEILFVLLEGESLLNDASSLTLFSIFQKVVVEAQHKPLGEEIGSIVLMTMKTAAIGLAIGIGMGIFTKYLFIWLQHRNMPPALEVTFTMSGAYLSFYITQVWCEGSGVVGTVAYGLYGSATLLWGMSNKVRQSGIFQHFWTVMTIMVNALIFFYVGASSVNFTMRASDQLYNQGGAQDLVSVVLYKLPIIYVYVFAVRTLFLFASFKILEFLRVGTVLGWQEILFLSHGGLRGSLSLVLAQTIATLTTSSDDNEQEDRVKAETAIYTAGFVLLTLIINAPLLGPAMTVLGLTKISKEQLMMRAHVKSTFFRFTDDALAELQGEAEDDEMLRGVDWPSVEETSDFRKVLDQYMPEEQPRMDWRGILYPQWMRTCVEWCCMLCGQARKQPRRVLNSIIHADEDDSDSEERGLARRTKALVKEDLTRMTAFTAKQDLETTSTRDSVLIIRAKDQEQWLCDQATVGGQSQGRQGTATIIYNANPVPSSKLKAPTPDPDEAGAGDMPPSPVQRKEAARNVSVAGLALTRMNPDATYPLARSSKLQARSSSALDSSARLPPASSVDEAAGQPLIGNTEIPSISEAEQPRNGDFESVPSGRSYGSPTRQFAQEVPMESMQHGTGAAQVALSVMPATSTVPSSRLSVSTTAPSTWPASRARAPECPSRTMKQQQLTRMSAPLSTAQRQLRRNSTSLSRDTQGALADMASPSQAIGDEIHLELLMEYRLRLLTGLKSYFKSRFTEGLLSPQSYKMLSYTTSRALLKPDQPLPLWHLAKQEVSSGRLLNIESHMYYALKCRINECKGSASWWRRQVLSRLLTVPAWLLGLRLNSVQLAGLEAAVELWISLTESLQTQWLQYSGPYGVMVLEEVHENAQSTWAFIVDRRIEEPEKFQSIQTYRASVLMISKQLAYVQEMSHGGMIDEKEAARMEGTMQDRLQRVCRAGPQWRRQSVREILQGVPFLRCVHPKVLQWVRSHSSIKVYGQGECIWEHWSTDNPPPGMFIVLSGMVRLMTQAGGQMQPLFLGSGGVGGLVGLALGHAVPGEGPRAAYAEGSALGKGPVVMHIPRELFVAIQSLSREQGLATWQQLDLAIHRTAAAYVLDDLRGQVTAQLGNIVRSALAACVISDWTDSNMARRQRIRTLVKEAFDGESGPQHLVHLDWPNELLELPPAHALALLEGAADSALVAAPWHKAMFQAIAATTSAVYDLIRMSVRESWLVVLAPGQTVWQTATMVLIQGALRQSSGGGSLHHMTGASAPPDTAAARDTPSTSLAPDNQPLPLSPLHQLGPRQSRLGSEHAHAASQPLHLPLAEGTTGNNFIATYNDEHVAPSVMVWTADYFDTQAPVQRPVPITAGSKGATLLVWGVDAQALRGRHDRT